MASIDLSIIQRGIQGTDWTPNGGKIGPSSLYKIGEHKTDNSGALNALPTPFARFFVVDEAFRRVAAQKLHPDESAGKAYERLVSDCLDVYELLFNKKYHDANKEKITVREWNKKSQLPNLIEAVPVLGNSVNTYLDSDLGTDITELYFVVLNCQGHDYLIGTSSPLTGFVTPPDLDGKTEDKLKAERYKGMPKLRRKDCKGLYFLDTLLFENRSEEFKNYMYNELFGGVNDSRLKYIREYISAFAADSEIRKDFELVTSAILTEDNNPLTVNGLSIKQNEAIGNYFTDTIIKLPYKISNENFVMPITSGRQIESGYLLPLSDEAVRRLDMQSITASYKEGNKKVTVTISVNGKNFEKVYVECGTKQRVSEGTIIDLEAYKFNFDLALFPRLRSADFYKLMIVSRDDNSSPRFAVDDISCDFFYRDAEENTKLETSSGRSFRSGVKPPVVRSLQSVENACGTKFYELFNTDFDFMRINIKLGDVSCSGVVVPKWIKTLPNKSYVYAIDLGTTNTFISKRERNVNLKPEQLRMEHPVVGYLHEKENSRQKAEIDLWDKVPTTNFLDYFQTEFIPAFIDGERYKFPLRTALSKSSSSVGQPALFDNRNIAFSYGLKKASGANEYVTDIKWNDNSVGREAEIFIEELLLLIKYDLMQCNAKVSDTELIWFRPLSFKGSVVSEFQRIWNEKSWQILGIGDGQVKCYTESEAPYYYFYEQNTFKSVSSVALVDIGGGSTDMVYFENDEPKFANSVHFGCDVLWGNGFNRMTNAKDNGIYKRYADKIEFKDEELKSLNDYMLSPSSSSTTKDIINFWLGHDDITKLSSKLQKEYSPLFLYHYASIIFYMATMIKSKGLSCPRVLLFSGNGSKYIDNFITSDLDILTELTMIVFKELFPECEEIQLILPKNRKESTCYGGLYRSANKKVAQPYIFMGVDDTQYSDVDDLSRAFESGLNEKIVSQINELNKFYVKMLKMLVKRLQSEDVDTDEIHNIISGGIKDSLEKNVKREVYGSTSKKIAYTDTLFFLPVVDIILRLTQKRNK